MREVQLILEPSSGRFDPHDDNWLAQVGAFVTELRSELGGVTIERSPVAGTKGTVDSIVLSLASAGTLTAMVEVLKSWLSRDRTRSLKVSWHPDGSLQTVELSGDGLDETALDDVVRSVSRRVAGPG